MLAARMLANRVRNSFQLVVSSVDIPEEKFFFASLCDAKEWSKGKIIDLAA